MQCSFCICVWTEQLLLPALDRLRVNFNRMPHPNPQVAVSITKSLGRLFSSTFDQGPNPSNHHCKLVALPLPSDAPCFISRLAEYTSKLAKLERICDPRAMAQHMQVELGGEARWNDCVGLSQLLSQLPGYIKVCGQRV